MKKPRSVTMKTPVASGRLCFLSPYFRDPLAIWFNPPLKFVLNIPTYAIMGLPHIPYSG